MYYENPIIRHAFTLAIISICFSVIVWGAHFGSEYEAKEREKRSSYTIYLDGEEVDGNTIDLTLYRCHYDDEKGIIYATRQSDNTRVVYVPIIR